MAVDTTFSMMVQLLKEAVDDSSALTDIMKAALKARMDALPQTQPLELTAQNVDSSTGVTVDTANDVITVPSGSAGEVIFDLVTFDTPVRIEGTIGEIGALIGHVGQGSNPAVPTSDITLQYRTSEAAVWQAFGRTVIIDEVSSVQFKAIIAAPGADADLPQLHILAEQL